MAQQVELEIAPRTVMGKATKRLRKAGIIPANIFGHKEESQAVQLEALAFERLRRSHGATKMLSLHMPDAASQTVLIRRVQRGPRSGQILHIDFYRVSLHERITLKISLHLVGESLAVKNQGGVLLHLLDVLDVECPASEIVDSLDVDISSLTEIDGTLRASDVKLPASYTLVTDPADAIAKVAATRVETVTETAAATPAPTPAAGNTEG